MTSDPPPNPVRDMQARFNRSTQSHWGHFAAHRAQVEQLLLPDFSHPAGRLCVLGAGNCNDLDLPRLGERFDEIHLVDLDRDAIEQAVRRQGFEGSPKLHLHAPVDLTGIADELGFWRGRRPSPGEVETVIRKAAAAPNPAIHDPRSPSMAQVPPLAASQISVAGTRGNSCGAPLVCDAASGRKNTTSPRAIPDPFDVVLSPCILSQIVGYARDALGRSHPRCRDLRLAVRQRHLRLVVDLLTPGGSGLIVSDMAKAEPAAPAGSLQSNSSRLMGTMNKLVSRGDGFADLDPGALQAGLRDDPQIGPLIGDVQFIRPWLWTLGPQKAFLVYAIRVRRSRGTMLLGNAK